MSRRSTFRSLIQPDIFLPSQFVDRHRPLVSSPLRRLSYAVLDRSLHDAGLYALVNRRPGNPAHGSRREPGDPRAPEQALRGCSGVVGG